MRKEREKYILYGKDIIPVYELADGQLITAGDIFDPTQFKVYTDRKDALYDKLVNDLKQGKPIDNYKSSKYFKYYVDRLKKDNPEYII
jgi:hypothetical protein